MKKRDTALALLLNHIEAAVGADPALDAEIERNLRESSDDTPDYTASVDRSLELLHSLLPHCHWHIGRDASGLMPYASLSNGKVTVYADGVTVPLVLLAVIVKALIEVSRP